MPVVKGCFYRSLEQGALFFAWTVCIRCYFPWQLLCSNWRWNDTLCILNDMTDSEEIGSCDHPSQSWVFVHSAKRIIPNEAFFLFLWERERERENFYIWKIFSFNCPSPVKKKKKKKKGKVNSSISVIPSTIRQFFEYQLIATNVFSFWEE
jgi:hypothetical protein